MNWRRSFLAVVAFAAGAACLPSHAQPAPAAKVNRVAVVSFFNEAATAAMRPFLLKHLSALGYVEGQNLSLELHSLLGLDDERQDAVVAETVRSRPAVILADGTNAAVRIAKGTDTIPIVLWASVDPVGAGLAQSLAHPGKNVTGLVTDVGAGAEEKRLDILLQLVPNARRIAFVGSQASWEDPWGMALRRGAARRNVTVINAVGTPASRYSESVETVKREKPDAVWVALSPTTSMLQSVFGKLTLEVRVPTSCGLTEMANRNCIFAYGQSATEFFVRSLTYVDRILKGARAGDLPMEQPTRFQLIINTKLANEIGLKVPQSLVLQADRLVD